MRKSDTRRWALEGLEANSLCVAAAVVGAAVVGGVASSASSKSAANKAAGAQTKSAEMGVEEQRRQFDALQNLLKPYRTAGAAALGQQQNLLGLNGGTAQSQAIQALQQSPQFTSLLQQGENSILQNASATGGLRGGNTQAALAQFSPALLAQTINDQYAKLGGITSLGQNAAAMQGNAGMQTGNNIANLLGQAGSAQAGNALAQGRANAGMWNSLAGGVGSYAGMGGFGQNTAAAGGATSGGLMSELGSYGVF